jgi:hypothetical protein
MKYLLISLLLIANNSLAQKYEYKSSVNSKDIDTVTFFNGDFIKVQKNEESGMSKVVAFDKNKKQIYGLNEISEGYIYLKEAYPNTKNSQVAIIETNCGGTICTWNGVYVAYIYKNKLNFDFIGDAIDKDFAVNVDIGVKNSPMISAIGVSEKVWNKYGDTIKGNRELVNGKGAISNSFNRDWLRFVGEHPEKFFMDKLKRESLAQKINFENFKELRSYLSGPATTYIKDGKYILMTGCMAHMCPNFYASILTDTTNSKQWALWIDADSKIAKYGTNDKWTNDIANILIGQISDEENIITFANSKFQIKK